MVVHIYVFDRDRWISKCYVEVEFTNLETETDLQVNNTYTDDDLYCFLKVERYY
jgi:hypothetical protein